MIRRNKIFLLIITLSFVFIAALTVSFFLYSTKNTISLTQSSKISSTQALSTEILGNTSYGYVIKEGPYGNTSSTVKIAYIVGVHPKESSSHLAIVDSIKNQDKTLKYCYYIYKINVTKDAEDYAKGRKYGQLLASGYVLPNAVKDKFQLVVDIHSNVGNWKENRFIFAPVNGSSSIDIANKIKSNLPWLTYYVPPNPTSPIYLTIPLIKSGVPAVIYETYFHEPYKTTRDHAEQFVKTVDKLNFLN